jgi:hypothetical protein
VPGTCAQRKTLTTAGFVLDGNKWDGLYIGWRTDLWGQSRLRFDNARAKMLRPTSLLYYPACASGGPGL